MKKIFWIAGENSGDLHAADVLKKMNDDQFYHFGIGGPKMQSQRLNSIFDFQRFAVMGFWEVVKHLKFFAQVNKKIKNIFQNENSKPDLVVLVDYPGLNMRIAKLAKRYKIPVLYYISPQFWAWKSKRIHQLKKYTDHIAYILPLEKDYFDKFHIPSTYVGHPIAEQIKLQLSKNEFAEKFGLDFSKKWIGFFPGSRQNEVTKLLPEFHKTISQLPYNKYEFIISRAHSLPKKYFPKNSKSHYLENYNYEIMKYSSFIVAKSGTTSLETAYIGTPFIIVYKTSFISYFLGKRLIKIDKIGLPNIMMQKKIVPELIQKKANSKYITAKIQEFLQNKEKYNQLKTDLQQIQQIMEKRSASQKTAEIIKEMLA
ncbi:MAG: lipid-A-disaccharide synthase [Candidatus Cloacimonadota bacterium]|nr:lipid-A-disaccharide synthase [Candidatus Cloacimonadota bacterium]